MTPRRLILGLCLVGSAGCSTDVAPPTPPREEDRRLERAVQEPLDKARAVEDALQKAKEAKDAELREQEG